MTHSEISLSIEPFLDEWDSEEDDFEGPPQPRWRRRLIVGVAILTAIALALVPLYNLLDRGEPYVADNGLEVCGYDYCTIQDAVRDAGLDLEMSRLSNLILGDDAAVALAEDLTSYIGVDDVGLTVVDRLGGRLGGVYDPTNRSIVIERPANAWVVVHEVAHSVAAGHGAEFQEVLIDLVAWTERSG